MDRKETGLQNSRIRNNPLWQQGDELLFTVHYLKDNRSENYHYECFSDGTMDCETDRELAGDRADALLIRKLMLSSPKCPDAK